MLRPTARSPGVCGGRGAPAPAVLWLAPGARCPAGALASGTRATSSIRSSSTRPIACARGRSRSGTRSPGRGSPGSPTGSRASSIRRRLLFLLPSAGAGGRRSFSSCTSRSRPGARGAFSRKRTSPTRERSSARRRSPPRVCAASLSVYWNHFGAWAYLPGIAALARSGLRSRAATLGFGALVGLQAMAGSPEISAASIGARGRPRRGVRASEFPGARLAAAARAPGCGASPRASASGLALAAWVLVPMAELGLHSDRRHAFSAEERDVGAVGCARCRLGVGLHARFLRRRRTSRRSFCRPSCWSPRPRRFREDHRRRLALLLAVFAAARNPARRGRAPGSVAARASAARPRPVPGEVARLDARSGSRCWPAWASTPCASRPARPRPRAVFGVAARGRRSARRRCRRCRSPCAWLLLRRRRRARLAGARPRAGARSAGALLGAAAAAGLVGRARPGARARAALRARVAGDGAVPDPSTPLSRVAGPRRHAADGRALGLGPARRTLRRRDARAPARGAARLHEPAVPRADGAHRGAAAHGRGAAAIGASIGAGRGRAAGGRRERARPVDAVSAGAAALAEDRRLLPRAARAVPAAARRSCAAIASSPTPAARGRASASGEVDLTREVLLDRRPDAGPRGPPRSIRCCSPASPRTRPSGSSPS